MSKSIKKLIRIYELREKEMLAKRQDFQGEIENLREVLFLIQDKISRRIYDKGNFYL